MKMKPILAAVIVLLLMVPFVGQAEEELFDTKAADQHLDQGIAYLKAKNYSSAIKEFETAAEINPDAEAYYYLGYTYYLKGRAGDGDSRTKSRENFERAYEIDPNFSPTRLKPVEQIPARVKQQEQTAQPASQETLSAPGPEQKEQPTAPADQAK